MFYLFFLLNILYVVLCYICGCCLFLWDFIWLFVLWVWFLSLLIDSLVAFFIDSLSCIGAVVSAPYAVCDARRSDWAWAVCDSHFICIWEQTLNPQAAFVAFSDSQTFTSCCTPTPCNPVHLKFENPNSEFDQLDRRFQDCWLHLAMEEQGILHEALDEVTPRNVELCWLTRSPRFWGRQPWAHCHHVLSAWRTPGSRFNLVRCRRWIWMPSSRDVAMVAEWKGVVRDQWDQWPLDVQTFAGPVLVRFFCKVNKQAEAFESTNQTFWSGLFVNWINKPRKQCLFQLLCASSTNWRFLLLKSQVRGFLHHCFRSPCICTTPIWQNTSRRTVTLVQLAGEFGSPTFLCCGAIQRSDRIGEKMPRD